MQTLKSRIRDHEHVEFCTSVDMKRFNEFIDKPWGLRRWDPECPPAPIEWDHLDCGSSDINRCGCAGAQARINARKTRKK